MKQDNRIKMNCKIFTNAEGDIEGRINEWLDNKEIKISRILQSTGYYLTISIWYYKPIEDLQEKIPFKGLIEF